MAVQYDRTRRKYLVRWQEEGRKRTRRFDDEAAARAFDETLPRSNRRLTSEDGRRVDASDSRSTASGDGVYRYRTAHGPRWRCVFRQSDGSISSRRGFTSRSAAIAARRKLMEEVRRGEVKVSREDFSTFWHRFLRDKRPYMTPASHQDLVAHGNKRLLPFFGTDRLARIDDERIREWMHTMVDMVEAGELAPKTVNNARTYLSMPSTRPSGEG